MYLERTFCQYTYNSSEIRIPCIRVFYFFCFLWIPDHAVYISVVELNHDSEKQESFLSVKVFTDDLQNIIRNFNPDFTQASNEQFVDSNEEDIAVYFSEHLTFTVNDELAQMEFVSSVLVSDVYFLNFKFKSSGEWKKLEITADFFTELFPDQSNVMTIKYKGEKYFARLTKSKPDYFIEF